RERDPKGAARPRARSRGARDGRAPRRAAGHRRDGEPHGEGRAPRARRARVPPLLPARVPAPRVDHREGRALRALHDRRGAPEGLVAAMSERSSVRPSLLHPLFGAALLVLVVNDHVLKGAGALPPLVTGKLSDVAGLLVAPAVLAWIARARTERG